MEELISNYKNFEQIQSAELKEAFSHLEDYKRLLELNDLKKAADQPKQMLSDFDIMLIDYLEKALRNVMKSFVNLKHDKSIFHLLKKRIKRILKDADEYFEKFSNEGKNKFIEKFESIQKLDRDVEDNLKTLMHDTEKLLSCIESCIKELEHAKKTKKRIDDRVGSLIKKSYDKLIGKADECISKIPKIEKYILEDYEFLKETHRLMLS